MIRGGQHDRPSQLQQYQMDELYSALASGQPRPRGVRPADLQSRRVSWWKRKWKRAACSVFVASLVFNLSVIVAVIAIVSSSNLNDCLTPRLCQGEQTDGAKTAGQIRVREFKADGHLFPATSVYKTNGIMQSSNIKPNVNEILDIPEYGIYLIYSKVTFNISANDVENRRQQSQKVIFKHEISERDIVRPLLRNAVGKKCSRWSEDLATGTCTHTSLIVSTLWLRKGYKLYVTTEPLSISDSHFAVSLISS